MMSNKQTIRIVCREPGMASHYAIVNGSEEIPSIADARETIRILKGFSDKATYTIVLETFVPDPVTKWRWAFQMKHTNDVCVTEQYSTDEEVEEFARNVQWVQKLEHTAKEF